MLPEISNDGNKIKAMKKVFLIAATFMVVPFCNDDFIIHNHRISKITFYVDTSGNLNKQTLYESSPVDTITMFNIQINSKIK